MHVLSVIRGAHLDLQNENKNKNASTGRILDAPSWHQ